MMNRGYGGVRILWWWERGEGVRVVGREGKGRDGDEVGDLVGLEGSLEL